VADAVLEAVGVRETLLVLDGEAVIVVVEELVSEPVLEAVTLCVAVKDGDTPGDKLLVIVSVAEGVILDVSVGESDNDVEAVDEAAAVFDDELVTLRVVPEELVNELLRDAVIVLAAVIVPDPDGGEEAEAADVIEDVSVEPAVRDIDDVAVELGDSVESAVKLGEELEEYEAVEVDDSVPVLEEDAPSDKELVRDAV